MFLKIPQNLNLTLLVYVTLVLILTTSSTAHIQHREHASLKRLIRKRSPSPLGFPLIPSNGAASSSAPSSSAPSSTNNAQIPALSSTSSSGSSASEASATSSASDNSLSQSSSSTTSESGASSSTSSTTASTTQSTTSTTAVTSETLNVTAAPQLSVTTAQPTLTQTTSVGATETSSDVVVPQSDASKAKSTTLIVIIVVAVTVGTLTIVWTIFRKWKLGRSAKFDQRLNPIDWQPTSPDDGAIPGAHRRLSGSSFHSGSIHGNSAGAGYGVSDYTHGSDASFALPNHDFTAGPSTLAPIGGYADLARGPSPQPQMYQVNQAPHLTNPRYDVGVPLHYQTTYGSREAYDSGRRY